MARADQQRWDRRHGGHDRVDVPRAPGLLRGHEHLLPPGGRVLDVACGRGAVAVWSALRGFIVDAVDVSPVALLACAALAVEHGVSDRVRGWQHDLDDGLPAALPTGYALVVCQRYRDPALYPVLGRVLAPGGLLAVSVLSRAGAPSGAQDDDTARFRAEPGELLAAFAALQVLVHREGDGEEALLAVAGPRS